LLPNFWSEGDLVNDEKQADLRIILPRSFSQTNPFEFDR